MEEMEVKVDPMLFLQCGMEQSTSEASDSSDNEEDITRTRTPEPLPLTNKLDFFILLIIILIISELLKYLICLETLKWKRKTKQGKMKVNLNHTRTVEKSMH